MFFGSGGKVKAIEHLGTLFCDLVDLGKQDLGWGVFDQLGIVCKSVKGVAQSASQLLDEAHSDEDLDQLADASYEMVKKVVKKISG